MPIKTYSVAKDGETLLSPHFKVKEFRPTRNGKPDGDEVKIDTELIKRLELLSDCVNNAPIYVNDGYRTEAFDIELTGKAGQHTKGRAADIRVNGYTAEQLCVYAEACGFTGVGTINANSIHVDTRQSNKVVCFRENGTTAGSEAVISSFLHSADWLHPIIIPQEKIASIEFVETREPVKTTAKKFDKALEEGNNEAIQAAYKDAVKKIDTAVSKGYVHKNTAARKKSQMTKKLNAAE